MPALADIAGILCDCPLSCKLLTVQACLPTVRFWPVADAQYRRILHANAILQRIKAVEVCGIKTRQANSKDRRRTPENPKGDLSGRLFPCSPSTGKSEAPLLLWRYLFCNSY